MKKSYSYIQYQGIDENGLVHNFIISWVEEDVNGLDIIRPYLLKLGIEEVKEVSKCEITPFYGDNLLPSCLVSIPEI
jgi:hypothetical protein